MSLEEVQAAYLGCPNAVELCEKDSMARLVWPLVRENFSAGKSGVDGVINRLKGTARLTLGMIPGGLVGRALPEMDHPDFKRYVAAKLGLL